MRVKMFITFNIDDEEYAIPADGRVDEEEYPIPADGRVGEELEDGIQEYFYDIEGATIRNIRTVTE